MQNIAPGTQQNPWLWWLKHRRYALGAQPVPIVPTPAERIVRFTANGTFTVPADVYAVDVEILGAGGGGAGGGGGASTGAGPGGGGGAVGGNCGDYVYAPLKVTPGETLTITVGTGGAGGAGGAGGVNATGSDGSEGADGTATIVAGGSQTITCPGGIGTNPPTAATRAGKGGTGSAGGAAGATTTPTENQQLGGDGNVLNTQVAPASAAAGASNVNGGGGGYGANGGANRLVSSKPSGAAVSPSGTTGGISMAWPATTEIFGLGLGAAPPRGGSGGPGNTGGAGAKGVDGAAGTRGNGGAGGGGGGGMTALGTAGTGGAGGVGGDGLVVLYYVSAIP